MAFLENKNQFGKSDSNAQENRETPVIRSRNNDEFLRHWPAWTCVDDGDDFYFKPAPASHWACTFSTSILRPPRCPPSKHSCSLTGPIPLVSQSEEYLLTSGCQQPSRFALKSYRENC